MAPRNMGPSEYGRYLLRASKQQSIRRFDATEVSSKIDFLNMIGLTKAIVKPCSVVITSEKCSVCGKNFKCKTDVDDHTRRKHGRKSRKIRVVSRIGEQIITERYVRRKYLSLPNRNRYPDPNHKSSHGSRIENIPISFVTPDTTEASDSEGPVQDESLEFSNFSDTIQEENTCDQRTCSAPSLGLRLKLSICRDNCDYSIENIVETKRTSDTIQATSQDQNNNSFNNNNISNERISKYEDKSQRDEIQFCTKSVSVQTPSWLEHRTLLESKAFTTNSKENIKHTHSIPIDDNIIDITSGKNFSIDDDFPMEESGDCEIKEILRITGKEPMHVVDWSEEDDKKPLLIVDAIRGLNNTETRMNGFDDFTENELEAEDDDVSYVLRLSPDENELRFQECQDMKLTSSLDEDDDEDDVSIVPLDPEERNYTFNVKEADEDFNYAKIRKLGLNEISMGKTYFNELDNKSKSWETSKIDRDRFTITSLPNFAADNDTDSFILIKEEVMIDHYSVNSDCE